METAEETAQKTLAAFIDETGLRMTAVLVGRNPHMDDMPFNSSHYRCTITSSRQRGRMLVYFSMGPAHTKPPTLADVLNCLASDASSYDNARSFEDWCSDFGTDTDSRRAERTYKAIEKQAKRLRAFLGNSAYEQLLWHTERE